MQTSIYSYCAAIVLYKIQNAERENNATFNTNLGYNLEEVSPTKQKNKIEEVKHTLPRSNYNKFYWMTYKKRKDKRKNGKKSNLHTTTCCETIGTGCPQATRKQQKIQFFVSVSFTSNIVLQTRSRITRSLNLIHQGCTI